MLKTLEAEAPTTSADLVARAEAMIPRLRERAFVADKARHVPDETIREMLDAKILQMLAPKRFGGAQESLTTFLDTGIAIGRGCGSSSWLFGILGCHHWILGHFPLATQEAMYAGKDFALWPLSFSGKGGTAREVDGGYIVSGQWGFCSGIDQSDWVGGAAMLDKENPDDLKDRLNFVVPKSEVEVVDTWFTAGMRGTGSRDFIAREVFVPRERVLSQAILQEGRTPGAAALPEYPALAAPFYGVLLAAVLCPVLGLAWRAIDDFTAFTRERVGFRGMQHQTRASTQITIGTAHTRFEAIHRMARAMFLEIDGQVREGRPFTAEQRLRQRRNACYIADEAVKLVDLMVGGSGARGQHETSGFQLIQRDIHTIRTHVVLDMEEAMEMYGRHLLGQDINSVRY